jgi:hypothetical protein
MSQEKKWIQPKLIVIGQGTSEENVLSSCKSNASPTGVLSTATQTNCNEKDGTCAACKNNGGKGS